MRGHALLLSALLAWGCGANDAAPPREISVTNYYFPPCRARILRDGEVLATIDVDSGRVAIADADLGRLAAEYLGPDGWTHAKLRVEGTGDDRFLEVGEILLKERIDLYFDNREGADAEVSFGQCVLRIPSGTTGAPGGMWISIPAPTTEAGSLVRLDGREVGRIVTAGRLAARADAHYSYLVDLSGRRRYRKTLWNYGDSSAPSHRYEDPLGPAHVILLDDFVAGIDFLASSPGSQRTSSSRIEILDWEE